jgi:hypothetical protein
VETGVTDNLNRLSTWRGPGSVAPFSYAVFPIVGAARTSGIGPAYPPNSLKAFRQSSMFASGPFSAAANTSNQLSPSATAKEVKRKRLQVGKRQHTAAPLARPLVHTFDAEQSLSHVVGELMPNVITQDGTERMILPTVDAIHGTKMISFAECDLYPLAKTLNVLIVESVLTRTRPHADTRRIAALGLRE